MKHPAENSVFLSGDEALAQGAYEQGLKVACSYPGTPATEIIEYLAKLPDIDCQWSVNEKVAYEVALAASVGGLRSLFSSKHVGLNVAMDSLMTSAYTGVGAGFIVVSADDPGIHSSQNEQDNRLFARIAKIPLLEPASPAECYAFTRHAFELSEKFDTPVMMRITTRVAHTKENVAVGQRKDVAAKLFSVNVPKYVMVPANAYRKHLELEKKMGQLKKAAEASPLNIAEIKDKRIGFVTSGVSYLYIKEMFPNASVLKLGMSFPFPEKTVKEFGKKVKKLMVIEELEPFLEEQMLLAGIRCSGKPRSYSVGELRPEYLPDIVKGKEKKEKPSTSRKPVMCPGCPHRAVFWVLKKLKAVVTGDIGCYTLGALPPLASLHTCLCMGSGITFFEGLRKAVGKSVVGVIGDSTFVHSGITGLINLAYNGTKGLVMILDNGTTAMTGSQPHPATGQTIRGAQTSRLVLEDLCEACGADNVDVVNPFHAKALEALVKSRMEEEKLSVIICRFPCRLIDRSTAPAPRYTKEKCKKCYICLALNCPALTKDDNGDVVLNADQCTGCNLCTEACVFEAIK